MAESNKKPNSFIKGMQHDLDPNVAANDSYKEALNGRILTKDDNLYTLSSAEGNSSVHNVSTAYKQYSNFSITNLGSDVRSVGSTDITVNRFLYSLTLSIQIGSTTYTYTHLTSESKTDGAHVIDAINAFVFPETETSDSLAIKSQLNVLINNNNKTFRLIPYYPSTVGVYNFSYTSQGKSKTFYAIDGLQVSAQGTNTDLSLSGFVTVGDSINVVTEDAPNTTWSASNEEIVILDTITTDIANLPGIESSDTTSSEDTLYIVAERDTTIAFTAELIRETTAGDVVVQAFVGGNVTINESQGYDTGIASSSSDTDSSSTIYSIVGLVSLSDYLVALCHGDDGDTIIKLTMNEDGTVQKSENLFTDIDLGFTDDTTLRIEVSEENDAYHRIYWTDGVNPLRTFNLKESSSYYQNLSSANQLNVFSSKYQKAMTVDGIGQGGSVRTGSHSYCYRLKSADGKVTKLSNITQPVPVFRTDMDGVFTEIIGGAVDGELSESGIVVKLSVDGLPSTFSTIEVINIYHTDEAGGIEANIIKSEGQILDGAYSCIHTGNETTIPVALEEITAVNASWTVCKTLAIKDNRLFAANLSNISSDFDLDFRVKSYRKNRDTGNWEKQTSKVNPDLYEYNYYDDGTYNWEDIGYYGYLKGSDFSGKYIPGAESDGYSTGEGVRVTFDVKEFDLSDVQYFRSNATGTISGGADYTRHNTVPLFSQNLSKSESGYYNNYKNPVFAEQYVGYQRGEIYRFGILFYDTNLNPLFVEPIGDVRFPDNKTNYATLNSSGNVVDFENSNTQTFKYCGSESFELSCTLNSTTSVTHLADDRIKDRLQVYGPGVPHGTYINAINSDTSFALSNAATVSDTNDLRFVDSTSDVKGYALYPKFDVKLSSSTLEKIGGYSIVRVPRTENNKRIIANGVLTPITTWSNNDSELTLKNKSGNWGSSHGHPDSRAEAMSQSTFTFDTPETTLGGKTIAPKGGDKVFHNVRLDSVLNDYTADNLDGLTASGNQAHNSFRTRTGQIGAGRFFYNQGGMSTSNRGNAACSLYCVYTLHDSAVYYNNQETRTGWPNKEYIRLKHIEQITPDQELPNQYVGYDRNFGARASRPYRNSTRLLGRSLGGATDEDGKASFMVNGGKAFSSHGQEMHSDQQDWTDDSGNYGGRSLQKGCTTNFLSVGYRDDETIPDDGGRLFEPSILGIGVHSRDGHTPNEIHRMHLITGSGSYPGTAEEAQTVYFSKAYVSIVRDVSESQYGGSDDSALFNSRYILTGHENFNPTSSSQNSVFGGDTYINMHSLRKSVASGDRKRQFSPNVGFVFPVESTVNVAMRAGSYLGGTEKSYSVEDDILYNLSYSASSNVRNFTEKPPSLELVDTYKNKIAVSDLKINGVDEDAYTDFPVFETHELDTKKGPIYNLFNLRDELFTLQSKGVAKLTVNPRVVVSSDDAAAVTIATGTGRVIERSDYVDTHFGSQHYNNLITTGANAYWYDSERSSFCKLLFGQAIAVQDVGLTTQNASVFDSLKDLKIQDNPLDTAKGGICLSYDERHGEVTVSISHPTQSNNITYTYSELSEVMVSKKYQTIGYSTNHKGETYTMGYVYSGSPAALSRSVLWRENSLGNANSYYASAIPSCLSVTFICNESVYSTKKFDKLVMYCSGNNNSEKFTTFTFTDSQSDTSFTNNNINTKMANGKHIIPITDGVNKAQGQYLSITASAPIANYPVELFGALVHNRITT